MSLIKQLAAKLNMPANEVTRFLLNAPRRYKVYTIAKRLHGRRTIAQPSGDLKRYQRAFLSLYSFPVHINALAYKKGKSIKDNALYHHKQRYLLKMDFENFFNTITPMIFWHSWENQIGKLPPLVEQQWIEKLLFWQPDKANERLILSIGAPSSPLISNFCLHQFDQVLTTYCTVKDIKYSRYADDLTFSTNEKGSLFTLPNQVQLIVKQCFEQQMSINHHKTVFSSKAHNRHVTGVTLSNTGQLSLGRERKRYIKHLVHQFILNKLSSDDTTHLQGLLSFAHHIEPTFLISLKDKYGEAAMTNIFEVKQS